MKKRIMARGIFFAAALILVSMNPALAAPLASGKIHTVCAAVGPNTQPSQGIDHREVIVQISNRGDRPINFHIDIYDRNGAMIARMPASGTYSAAPNSGTAISFYNSPELASFNNENFEPVIVWSGRVSVTPTCLMWGTWFDNSGNFVSASGVLFYDDSTR